MGTNSRELPDWVTGELGASADNSLVMDLLKDKYSSTPVKTHHRYFTMYSFAVITYRPVRVDVLKEKGLFG